MHSTLNSYLKTDSACQHSFFFKLCDFSIAQAKFPAAEQNREVKTPPDRSGERGGAKPTDHISTWTPTSVLQQRHQEGAAWKPSRQRRVSPSRLTGKA